MAAAGLTLLVAFEPKASAQQAPLDRVVAINQWLAQAKATLAVTVGALPDGTEYPDGITLKTATKGIVVTATNSEFRTTPDR